MRCHDERGASLSLLGEVVAHIRRGDWIEAGRRLVAEDPVGIVPRGADQGDLLRHAARVGREHGVGAVGQLEALEQPLDPLATLDLWDAVEITEVVEVLGGGVASVEPRLVGHDAEPRTNRVEAIGNPQPVELDESRISVQDSAQASQGRRLARPVLAEKDEDLAALDAKVHAADSRHVTETLEEAFDADQRCKPRPGGRLKSSRTSPPAPQKPSRPRPAPRPGTP